MFLRVSELTGLNCHDITSARAANRDLARALNQRG
jgi:hypothetical protein